MTKSEKIRILLEKNQDVLLNEEINNGICFDGIVDELVYDTQDLKVAVLLKETNGNDFSGNEILKQNNWDYVYWLKHQQVNNEPEYRLKDGKEYLEKNVFYHHTFKKLCHWLSILFDLHKNGKVEYDDYLKDGKVNIEKVRSELAKVAIINLKKSWGNEKTDVNKLAAYATSKNICQIIKEQISIIDPMIVLCCSPDVFWIATQIYDIDYKKDIIREQKKEMFVVDGKIFVKGIHPQWYGKNEEILAEEMRELFEWVLMIKG